jgi:Pyruvate/2-oxoacid:ferredoxin oxidoreductase gamma subunit
MAEVAGASFVARAFIGRDTTDLWTEALDSKGFSLIEIVGTCQAYGMSKVKDLESVADYPKVRHSSPRPTHDVHPRETKSLFEKLDPVSPRYTSALQDPVGVTLAGSAGEGIQSAGQLLASAGMVAGLHATKKGEYPITVGTGFSVAEVILSPKPIQYTAISRPQVLIAVSENGLRHVVGRVGERTALWVDDSLDGYPTQNDCTTAPLRKQAGGKGAAIAAIATWLRESGTLPLEAFMEAIQRHPRSDELQKAANCIP